MSSLNSVERAALKKLLPRGAASKQEEPISRYPAALLSKLPKGESYSLAGYITEELLRDRPCDINTQSLTAAIRKWSPDTDDAAIAKIIASKTTEPYLQHIRETRIKMRNLARGALVYDAVVASPIMEGHPDVRTATQIFEVKMTGQMAKNWVDFCLQVFAYAALAAEITDVYLVLPLQEIVWHASVKDWTNRVAYREAMHAAIIRKTEASGPAAALVETYKIGSHMSKARSLADTIYGLPISVPSQIFLCGPQSSKLFITDEEIAAATTAMQTTGITLFIHSQYLINLCNPDDFHTALLIKNLQYGVAIGAQGVVVHVGKSTTQPLEEALAHMRTNIVRAIQHATPTCPLLLETPAGQGSEVLTTWATFAAFVSEIADPRLRICIDTCHVFAVGDAPLTYLQRMVTEHPGLAKLIHFNDSATPCGSCLDRHAYPGQGHIGIALLTEIAVVAAAAAVPMIME